ncbi:MAG: acyl-ACP--UDP-N-acetylglucosamine O-acyltransferase [Deltaproteobacteria bacterium]|nr:MAG: acyl-ACP--UDP-N-acetylglucosamine O-acyltransferase [Deltaproteobacteria bacterium]
MSPSAAIGPYVVIEGPVRIGPRTRVMAGVYLAGRTELGADNVVHPGAVLGDEPQDLAYTDAPTGLRIGDRNVFREHTEVHRATQPDTWTEIGDDNYLMSQSHVAHNCRLGHRVIVATGALLGGHVVVEDQAFISGNCVVHQHCRVGRLAIMRGLSRASRDVPPFAIMDGTHTVRGLNRVGLRRAGFDAARIRALATAFRVLFRVRTNMRAAIARVEAEVRSPDVDYLLAFLRASVRGVATGPRLGTDASGDEA